MLPTHPPPLIRASPMPSMGLRATPTTPKEIPMTRMTLTAEEVTLRVTLGEPKEVEKGAAGVTQKDPCGVVL